MLRLTKTGLSYLTKDDVGGIIITFKTFKVKVTRQWLRHEIAPLISNRWLWLLHQKNEFVLPLHVFMHTHQN